MDPFTTHGAVSWHELTTPDVAAAKRFYAQVFGWQLTDQNVAGMDYTLIQVGGGSIGGLNARTDAPAGWQQYVTVDDIDAAVARAEAAGGQVAVPPTAIPTVGRFAVIADPQGTTIAAIQYEAASAPATKPTLYAYGRSHHSRRVLALMHAMGIALDIDWRDLPSGAHRTPELQAMNPGGMLPLLVDGDLVLSESNAILMYLADKHGPSPWYPAQAQSRAKVQQWLSWQMCQFGPTTSPFVFEHIIKPLIKGGEPDLARLDKARDDFLRFGAVLDAHLKERDVLVGDAPTIADLSIASNLMYAQPAKIPVGDLPHVKRWLDRIEALPAWQASAPQ